MHSSKIEGLVDDLGQSKIKLHELPQKIHQMHPEWTEEEVERMAVQIRRTFVGCPSGLPLEGFRYDLAAGSCCENMIGHVSVPVGIAGPLIIDGKPYNIPLATTEGALVASTNRGCKAVSLSSGITTVVTSKSMARGPFIKYKSIRDAQVVHGWLQEHWSQLGPSFEATSRHMKLVGVRSALAGRYLFLRVSADTGEAMGMNMVSKGTEALLNHLIKVQFPQIPIEACCLSGNFCTDKKAASAVNWVDGRGYSVTAEARITSPVLEQVLRVTAPGLASLATAKNLVGSAMAGVGPGGQNSHAANLVAAIFLACGQDPAQVVESAACLTHCEADPEDGSLVISCTMPCVEVGVIGGGTRLPGQSSLVGWLCDGFPEGRRAEGLARLVAATVLAGELSLLAALQTGSLVSSHLALNRK